MKDVKDMQGTKDVRDMKGVARLFRSWFDNHWEQPYGGPKKKLRFQLGLQNVRGQQMSMDPINIRKLDLFGLHDIGRGALV